MFSTEAESYTRTAKILHWLVTLAILFMLALGWSFGFFPKGNLKSFLLQLHKSIGITILLLSFLCLGWRLMHKAPPFPASMSIWEQRAAHIGHVLLYVMMIGMPLSGWAIVSAESHNIPLILYGVLPWPHVLVPSDLQHREEMADILDDVHADAAYVVAVLAVGHIAAALKHHFIAHDGILLRMAPRCCAGFLDRLRERARSIK